MSKAGNKASVASVMKAAAASKKKEITEDELRGKQHITPEDVLALSRPCQGARSAREL